MNEEGVEGLLAWWEAQPRRRRNDLELKTALIQRLIDCNDHESAYEFTLEIMKKLGDNTPISPELSIKSKMPSKCLISFGTAINFSRKF